MSQHPSSSPRTKVVRLALAIALVAQMALVVPAGMAAAPPGTSNQLATENAVIRGHLGGYFNDYELDGTMLYAATHTGLQVFDVSDPGAPGLSTEYVTSFPAFAVAASGGNVFLASSDRFWAVSPVGTPSMLGSCDLTSGNFSEMSIVGDRAVLAGGARLAIVDISDPSAPTELYSIGGFSYVTGFDIVDGYAYLADRSAGQVKVVDISPGSAPALVNTVAAYNAGGVDIVGGNAYVAMGEGLQVLDVSTPGTPTVLAGPDNEYNGFKSVSVEGTACFLAANYDNGATWSDGLYVYDITDPISPVDTKTFVHEPPGMDDLQVASGTAFVMNQGGFRAYDVSTPTAPALVGEHRQVNGTEGFDYDGDLLYIGSQSYGLGVQIVDVSEPGTPTPVGAIPVEEYFAAIDASGTVAYMALSTSWPTYTHEFWTVDVTDPAATSVLDSVETTQPINDIDSENGYAYAGQSNGVVQIFDIADPANISMRGSAMTTPTDNVQVSDVVVSDGYVYAAYADWGGTSGVAIIDASDPDAPTLLTRYEANAAWGAQQIGGLFLDGTTLWVTAHNIGLIALDVSDPANPVELSRSATSINRGPVWVDSGKAFVFTEYTVEIMDASDPTTSSVRIGRVYPNNYYSPTAVTGAANGDDFWFVGFAGVFSAQWGDYTPPQIWLGVWDGDYYNSPITPDIEITGSNIATQGATLDDASYAIGTEISSEGTHTLSVWARKLTGVATTESATFVLDFTAPQVNVSGVEHMRIYEDSVTPQVAVSDAHLLSVSVTLDGSGYTPGTPVTTLGKHTLAYDARDRAGNRTRRTMTFYVRDSSAPADESRLAGDSRYDTAVRLSRDSFPAGSVDTVVIATGMDFPDALAGAPLAWAYGSPILLVEPNSVPKSVATEIGRLGATKAILLGGSSAVSDAVKTRLKNLGLSVERIAGDNRYHTAQLIAQRLRTVVGEDLTTAFIATGDNFPDAVAGAGIAAHMQAPILLVAKNSVPGNTSRAIDRVGVTDTVVLGSADVVSDSVKKALPSAQRLGGTDRFDTARRIAEYALLNGFWEQEMIVATGEDFPDALAAGVICAQRRAPAILVSDDLPAASRRYVQTHATAIWKVTVAGGTGTVPDAVVTKIRALLP